MTKRPRRENARDAVDDDDDDDEYQESAERSSAMPNTAKQVRARRLSVGGELLGLTHRFQPAQMRTLLEALPVIVSRVPLGSHRDLLGLLTEVFAAIISACTTTPLETIATSSVGLGAHEWPSPPQAFVLQPSL